jgi:GTP-binding protein Era
MPHRFGFAALCGPPNAGKSTLLNALLGQKVAIVSSKPQTTRNQISGILTRESSQMVIIDTPGVMQPRATLHRYLLESAWNALAQADVVACVLDAGVYSARPGLLDKDLAPLTMRIAHTGRPVLAVLNKIDAIKDKKMLLPLMAKTAQIWPGSQALPVSALREQGLDDLIAAMEAALPISPPMFPEDQLSTLPVRFMAAEIIREKLFLKLRQELPYETAVEIEDWQEPATPKAATRISAVIYATRDNHKGIIIGHRGETLKAIGTEARLEIEDLTGGKVHLELFVKIKPRWTDDATFMRMLGLGE